MTKRTAIKHILLAYDVSDEADHAFEYAREIARRFDAALEVLSVITRPAFSEGAETRAALEEGARKAKQGQRRLRHVTQREPFPIQFLTKVGRAPEQILSHAQESAADLIVMGHRHRSGLDRVFTRSTVTTVVKSSACPVLIVP